MFVFISGYFFDENNLHNLSKYIINKIKKLVIPFYIYNIIFLFITIIFSNLYNVQWPKVNNLKELLFNSLTYGVPIDLCSSGWFVIMLAAVSIIYVCIRKLFSIAWNDVAALALFIVIGFMTVCICHNNLFEDKYLLLIKCCFFIQFYQLGFCYKKYFEEKINKCSDIYISTIIINIVCIYYYSDGICFNSCTFMKGFTTDNYVLPFITSLTGILFWLTISKNTVIILGDDKIINNISNNTFPIMMTHLFFYNLLNLLFKAIDIRFNESAFTMNSWYQYKPISQFGIIYIIVAIVGALIIIQTKEKSKKILRSLK